MNRDNWNGLSFFEQLSNIDGDVARLIRAHEKYLNHESERDNGYFYLDNIRKLLNLTFFDPKNKDKGYRAIELMDELALIEEYLNGRYDADYIKRYWNQYTKGVKGDGSNGV